MYKISLGVLCLVLAIIFGNAMIVTGSEDADKMCVPMGSILLKPLEGVEAKRPPVDFQHSTHFGSTCQTCHHKWVIQEPIVGCSTTDCHDVAEAPKPSEKGAIDKVLAARYYKKAYHSLCISCHREMQAQNKALEMSGRILTEKLPNTGPTSCIQCHVKEEE
ncbi:MAG: cytochrome c3 family protein [Desulfobacterales bacterium]|nr:cytochrome c3 family protein [Desulfobacterales bacterium]